MNSLDAKYDKDYIPYYQKMQHQISVIGKETKKAMQNKQFGRIKEDEHDDQLDVTGLNQNEMNKRRMHLHFKNLLDYIEATK